MKKLSIFSLIVSLLFVFSCEDKKDTTPPELTIVSPTSGSTVGETVQIKVQTTDESGILKVDFYIQNSIKTLTVIRLILCLLLVFLDQEQHFYLTFFLIAV